MPTVATLAALVLLLTPPSGRPPEGPLERYDPEIYDVAIEVTLAPPMQRDTEYQQQFELDETPIVMPVIFMSTFHVVDADSLSAAIWLDGRSDPTLNARSRLDPGSPFQTQLAIMPLPKFTGNVIRWRLGYRAQVWSSRINDAMAARIAWPREWPDEVGDGLKPQMFIESDNPIFKATIERISGGELRMVPPYFAAKDIVRYCIQQVQVQGDGVEKRNLGLVHGLTLAGALATAERGTGSTHDLVCLCVAMLRSAGIPARPVIGVQERIRSRRVGAGGLREAETFVSWGEFFLPGAGWIPFDPEEMGNKVRTRPVEQSWPGFGSLDELNERVPLAFHYVPPASVEVPEYPAIWGWSPQPAPPSYGVSQTIVLDMVSRGKGVEDDRRPGGR